MNLLYVLLAFVLGSSPTQTTLSAPTIWLEPFENGVLALLADGELVYSEDDALQSYGTGWLSDSIITCGGTIYGNFRGQLAKPDTEMYGPEVATHHRPACLSDRYIVALFKDASELLLLDADVQEVARAPVNALPDAEVVLADVTGDGADEVVILTDPTERYAHGVLGDAAEAASVSVFDGETLEPLASYTLPEPFVFEQRRVTPFDLGDKEGLLATRSSAQSGAGVVLLGLEDDELGILAEAEAIGTGFRWLNLFASRDGSAFAVRTPHIGGPLQRYRLTGDALEVESYDLGVTNHVNGARNLDLGVLLPVIEPDAHHLVLPAQDLRSLKHVRCGETCEIIDALDLGARLSSNLVFSERNGGVQVVAGAGERLVVWQIVP